MIYLLGGSGYVGQAYQALLTRKGVPFRNVRRADLDYSNLEVLTAALRRDHPESRFLRKVPRLPETPVAATAATGL
ncbi:MAG TPA: hypothetical protein PLU52_08870 [Opitutaceae bacterium]|nr:hypothetical protein [Opitutaceae bacterium]